MKKFLNLAVLMLSAAMLLATSCKKDDPTTPAPKPEPEQPFELAIDVVSVSSSTISYKITPNRDDATYYVGLYSAEELDLEREIVTAAALLIIDQTPNKGSKVFNHVELKANKEYRVLCFGYDPEEKRYTTQFVLSDIIKTEEAEITNSLDIKVVDGSETWRNAAIDVTASQEELEYIIGFMEKSEWESQYAQMPQLIIVDRISGWKYDLECGKEIYPELDTWQKYMQLNQISGSRRIYAAEYYNLHWGTEYVMYAFGMNDDGDTTAQVVATEFATTEPVASDNSFEVVIGEVTSSTVAFTVTAANNDPYFLTIQDKRYVERFGEGKDESWDDMIFDLTFGKTDDQIMNYLFAGSQELTNESINKSINTLHEYQVVIWGFNNGPTTEVYVSEAFQPVEEVVDLSLYLDIVEVGSDYIQVGVTTNTDKASYYIDYVTAEEFGDDYGLTYISELYEYLTEENLYYGDGVYNLSVLEPDSEYYVIAFGFDAELGEPTTELVYEYVRTMPVAVEGDLFTISVNDITWKDATISVTTDLEEGYIFGIYTAEEFATLDQEAIFANRKAIWESNAEWYTDTTWQDMMAYDVKYGNTTLYASYDITKLTWDEDYVFYCMGVDAEGNMTTQMATAEFSTVAPVASDCTFDITIDAMTKSSVTFTVTPSNPEEQYYVTVQKANVLAPYGPDQEKSYEDLIEYLTPSEDALLESRLFVGTQTLKNSDVGTSVNGFYEYRIVVWGFNNGPTTTVYMSDAFKPADQ